MRLLKRDQDGELSLTKDLRAEDIPQYAILSHTWAPDSEEEVTFRDFSDGTGRSKLGYKKIHFCADQARCDGLQHFWVDTCCIDKADSNETAEAIASMFRWYQNATRCYVYLSDVSAKDCPQSGAPDCAPWEPAFRASRWFTRGWTLQELLAPAPEAVLFFDRDGMLLGDKTFLSRQIYEITQVPVPALLGTPLAEFGIEDRFAWAKERNTTREEDWAYSLQGIFGVYLLHKYGEGKTNAVRRLRREIKDAVCGADGQDIVTDPIDLAQMLDILPIDTAFEEALSLLARARAQVQSSELIIQHSAERSRELVAEIVDTKSAFLTLLRGLLRYGLLQQMGVARRGILAMLETQLSTSSTIVYGAIASRKEIASDLSREVRDTRKTLDELKTVHNFIQGQKTVPAWHADARHRASEGMQTGDAVRQPRRAGELEDVQLVLGAGQAEEMQRQNEAYAKLRHRIPELEQECRELQRTLKRISEQAAAQQAEMEAKIARLEVKQNEADRMRRGDGDKTTWEIIWGWIYWLVSCGIDDDDDAVDWGF